MRKPLANILGLVDLIDKNSFNEDDKGMLDMLKMSSQELDDVVREITEICDKLRS